MLQPSMLRTPDPGTLESNQAWKSVVQCLCHNVCHARNQLALQVTLFKRNYAHVVSESYFKSYHTVARGNPNYFITYGNGKSAARVRPGLRPNGAHRWYNYFRAPM